MSYLIFFTLVPEIKNVCCRTIKGDYLYFCIVKFKTDKFIE